MATTCPSGFDVDRLREEIQATYTRLALAPEGDFPFHRGVDYAVQRLGYDGAELAQLPPACVARFAGVGNPLLIGPLHPGEVVLDHACGAGLDLLLAARRVGAAARGARGRLRGTAGAGRQRRRRDLERRRQSVAG